MTGLVVLLGAVVLLVLWLGRPAAGPPPPPPRSAGGAAPPAPPPAPRSEADEAFVDGYVWGRYTERHEHGHGPDHPGGDVFDGGWDSGDDDWVD